MVLKNHFKTAHIYAAQNIATCEIEGKDVVINEISSEIVKILRTAILIENNVNIYCIFWFQIANFGQYAVNITTNYHILK